MKNIAPEPVVIAQKQRHLYLLTKVRDNRHLSRAEMKELNELEEKMTKNKNQTVQTEQLSSRAEIAETEIIRTQEEAALLLGKSTRTIRRYEKEGMPTAIQNNKKVYIRSMLLLYAANEGKKPTETKQKKEVHEAGIKATRDERERMELEILKGKWLRKDDIDRDNIQKVLAVKSGIFALVRIIITAVPAEHQRRIKKIAFKEARRIITGFST